MSLCERGLQPVIPSSARAGTFQFTIELRRGKRLRANDFDGDACFGIGDLAHVAPFGFDHEAVSAVQCIVDDAAATVPGAGYAAVTVATATSRVDTPAASHPHPVLLDAVQEGCKQGPSLGETWRHRVVRIDDLSTESRWPRYRRDALRVSAIRSILCFRLFVSTSFMGSFNLYADAPHAFDQRDEELGYALAIRAALAWKAQLADARITSMLAAEGDAS